MALFSAGAGTWRPPLMSPEPLEPRTRLVSTAQHGAERPRGWSEMSQKAVARSNRQRHLWTASCSFAVLVSGRFCANRSKRKLFQLSRERHQQLHSTASSPAAPAASPSAPMQVSEKSVNWLLFASCLSLLGFTMPGPALPGIRSRYTLHGFWTGLVAASMSMGMLVAVTFWPHKSDSWGRRRVLKWSLSVTTGLYAVQALALMYFGFQYFVLARVVTGFFAGCNPIFKAYLADVVPSDRLPFYMVWREASATMAFIIGPTVGGILTTKFGITAPFVATAVAHFVGVIVLVFFVEESKRHVDEEGTPNYEVEEAQKDDWPLVRKVFAMSFCYVVSQTCFTFFMPLHLNDTFNFQAGGIGKWLSVTSVAVFVFQVCVYKPFEKWKGLEKTGIFGAVAIFIGLFFVACTNVVPDKALLCIGVLFYAFGSATFPTTVPTLLAQSVPKHHRGKVLGLDSFMNNIGRVLTPLGLGILYGRNLNKWNRFSCFFVAGSASLLVAFLLEWVRRERTRT